MPANRSRHDATVEVNRPLCREHFLLRLRITGPFPRTQPGQFVQLGCRPPNGAVDEPVLLGAEWSWQAGQAPQPIQQELCHRMALLRRPFSLAGRGDDQHGSWIEIVHRVVGVGTGWLAELKPGDAVDLIGPLGNSFTLPPHKSLGLLVGGGVGLPPMFYLAQRLHREGWDAIAFVGAMTRDLLAVTLDPLVVPNLVGLPTFCVREFAACDFPTVLTTDDGSLGLPGRITLGLTQILQGLPAETLRNTVVFTCGPDAMMRAVAELADAKGVECQVCVEQAMACGMGTCQSCVVRIDADSVGEVAQARTESGRPWRYKLACTDGPVFQSTQIVW
jgi:dihydroorotate dehydrogenase electron transfer subunit